MQYILNVTMASSHKVRSSLIQTMYTPYADILKAVDHKLQYLVLKEPNTDQLKQVLHYLSMMFEHDRDLQLFIQSNQDILEHLFITHGNYLLNLVAANRFLKFMPHIRDGLRLL